MGWLIALGILVILAILPLGATVRYNMDGLALKLILGPLRIGILPKQNTPKEKSKKPPKKKSGKPAAANPQPKPKEKGGPITDFFPLVRTALELLNAFRKKLRINRLEMKLIMAGDDPCDLAVNYGKAWAALGNLMPQLERCFVIKKRDLEVECDFASSETRIIARADVTITLGWLLAIVVFYGIRAVKKYIQIKNKRKGGATK